MIFREPEKKEIPRRPPANVETEEGSIEVHYKDDNKTIDYEVVTKRDGTKFIRRPGK